MAGPQDEGKRLLDSGKTEDPKVVSQLLTDGYEDLNLGETLARAVDNYHESIVELL